MATPELLTFDDLLAPIPGDEPSGESVPFSVRQQFEEYRKEVNPSDYAEDDPTRPTELKRADWSAIIELAKETLSGTSKDLLVAARLTEGLLKAHGFAGLRDGLHLMRRMIVECWDRMHPDIDDGDLEVRAGPFNWLDDADRGARFPTSVRMTPIVQSNGSVIGWHHWKQIQEGSGNLTSEDFEKAVMQMPRDACQDVVDDIEGVRTEMADLLEVLGEKLEHEAPGLQQINMAVTECGNLANQILQRKGPGDVADDQPQDDTSGDGVPAESGSGAALVQPKRGATRDDIYQRLKAMAGELQRMEPHSPIPYLIQKAVDLGAMPFPQLMKALIRDEGVNTEMNRELGINESEESGQGEDDY